MTATRTNLPPGPGYVGTVLRTLSYMRDSLAAMHELRQKYGDPLTVYTPVGPVVETGTPENIRAIFTADPETFEVFGAESIAPFLGADSVLLHSGNRHKAERKLLAPPFHGARMRAYGRLMQEVAQEHASCWATNKPFAIEDTTRAISLAVIVRAIFGVTEPERAERFCRATTDYVASLHPLLISFPGLRRELCGLGPWARLQRCRMRLDSLLHEEIALRRQNPEEREDILSLLIGARYDDGSAMDAGQIRDQLVTLLFAGHETTATALAWAMYRLHQHAAVRHRLLDQLHALGPDPSPEALASEPYLDAVCHETLRLHPVAGGIGRMLKKPLQLGSWTIPAGVGVIANIIFAHQRPEVYPEPAVWNPERFLGRTYSPFEYLPFGGGARRCLGSAFALYEMKIVLATLLSRYELRLTDTRPLRTVQRNATLGPERGVPMVLVGKRAA